MSLCKQCIEGTTWEGEPIGKVEKIGDVDVYVSLAPEGSGDKTKALLYLPDVFSLKLVNNKVSTRQAGGEGLSEKKRI